MALLSRYPIIGEGSGSDQGRYSAFYHKTEAKRESCLFQTRFDMVFLNSCINPR